MKPQPNGLASWQRQLVERLERAMSRPLTDADLSFVTWNMEGRTLTVLSSPLLLELRARNLVSNVFRTFSARQEFGRPYQSHKGD